MRFPTKGIFSLISWRKTSARCLVCFVGSSRRDDTAAWRWILSAVDLKYVGVRLHCYLYLRKVVRKSGLSDIWSIPRTEPYVRSDMTLFVEGCMPLDATGANKPRYIGKFSYFTVRSIVCQDVAGVHKTALFYTIMYGVFLRWVKKNECVVSCLITFSCHFECMLNDFCRDTHSS